MISISLSEPQDKEGSNSRARRGPGGDSEGSNPQSPPQPPPYPEEQIIEGFRQT